MRPRASPCRDGWSALGVIGSPRFAGAARLGRSDYSEMRCCDSSIKIDVPNFQSPIIPNHAQDLNL